ncbi:MAG: hypothetical protein EBS01_10815, partial [Verrucomicrobia bacterium]|nr:hypothetical protein [Verrucomicrobiota bacterium]
TVSGGTLAATINGGTNNQLGASALTLGAGSLFISKSDVLGGTQTYVSTALSANSSAVLSLNITGGSYTLNTGSITRNAGSTVLINLPNTSGTINAGGSIIGNWALVNTSAGMFFAGTSAAGIIQAAGTTALSSFTTTITGTENATDFSAAGFSGTYTNPTGAASLRSLRFNTTGAGSLTIGTGSILNITGGAGLPGGILDTTNVGANTTSIAGGALTSSGGELVVFQQNTGGTLSISSRIENSYNFGGAPAALALTKAGEGVLLLNSAVNTYSGATNINMGTLLLAGGNAIGDRSQVILSNRLGARLDLGGVNETIGGLSGGGYLGGGAPPAPSTIANSAAATVGGEVAIGTATLTVVQQSSSATYAGAITGTGTLSIQGAFPSTPSNALTFSSATNAFSGALKINNVQVYLADGAGLPVGNAVGNFLNVSSVVLSNGAGLRLEEAGYSTTSFLANRLSDTAPIMLLNTGPNTALSYQGLTVWTDVANVPANGVRFETVGPVTLAGGNNTLRAIASGTNVNVRLTLGSLTRTNNATVTVLGDGLDSPLATRRGDIVVSNPGGLLGSNLVGGGALYNGDLNLNSNQISILPWAVGQASVGTTAGYLGNSFVTYNVSTGFSNGFRALNTLYEYEQLTASGGTMALNNVRYSGQNDLTLTGSGHTMNALLFDSATASAGSLVTLSGAGALDSLTLASGALLFTGSSAAYQPMTLTGFGAGIATLTGEYIITQNNNAAGGVLLSSPLTSSGTLTKSGLGLLKLSAANTTLSSVFVNQGILGIVNAAAINAAPVTLAGGLLGFTMDGDATGKPETLSAGTLAVTLLSGVEGGFAVDRLGNGISTGSSSSMLRYQQ